MQNDSIAAAAGEDRATLRRFGRYALFASGYTYALIVFGAIVRITDSGMGCGDDWPKCHGAWIPTFTLETFIEWMHRLLAAGIGVVVLAIAVYAFVHRRRSGFSGPGGVLRPMALALVLLVLQGALGAITVKLELPTAVSAAHFVMALVFIAVLLVAMLRAGVFGGEAGTLEAAAARKRWRSAATALAIGFVVVTFGALTANLPGSPQACQGFPLCNGQWLPEAAPTVHTHWSHRLFAFLLFFHVLGATIATVRRAAPAAIRRAAIASFTLILVQLVTAAALVLLFLPQELQVLHLVVGVLVWCALVIWAGLARNALRGSRHAPVEPAAHALDPWQGGR
jgi:heme a synthase